MGERNKAAFELYLRSEAIQDYVVSTHHRINRALATYTVSMQV